MRSPRTFAALAFALLGLAVGVPSASAIDPFPIGGVATLSSANFTVHYNANDHDPACPDFITQQDAGDLLGLLERARSFYTGMGYPAPVPDVDAHVHVSVDHFLANGGCTPYGAIPFGVPLPLDRWDSVLEPIGVPQADNIHFDAHHGLAYPIVAHAVFHLVEDAMAPGADQWLQEGTAEWASVRANRAAGGPEKNPDRSMDCVGAICGDSDYDKNGYPGWMLVEYLAERYGDAKVKTLWDQAAANPGSAAAADLAAVIDVPLTTFYNDYANARLTGNFTLATLKGALPETIGGFTVGNEDASTGALNIAVNHLAARYLYFKHAPGVEACFQATLAINVTMPAGVPARPAFYAGTVGATAQALTVSGTTATITAPWNTCSGSPDAYLSLPNNSLDLDGREFLVKATLDVDFTKPAAPSDPPPGAHVIGPVLPVPVSDPAPTLKVYAPEVLHVSAKTRLLRFVVFASGDGKLQAALGSTSLGSAALRSGSNDVRFVLPSALFKSLRTKSASSVLSLTSQSPTGAKGATVTRRVVVQTPPKPKKKAKKKH